MSIIQQDESSLDITLGQVLRLPCKFIQGKSGADKAVLKSISQQLQDTGKNILPVIVKALDEDDYQAVLNTQILDAARLAKLDFIWCIIVNDQMQTQVRLSLGSCRPRLMLPPSMLSPHPSEKLLNSWNTSKPRKKDSARSSPRWRLKPSSDREAPRNYLACLS
jgi:hypothetical protein